MCTCLQKKNLHFYVQESPKESHGFGKERKSLNENFIVLNSSSFRNPPEKPH